MRNTQISSIMMHAESSSAGSSPDLDSCTQSDTSGSSDSVNSPDLTGQAVLSDRHRHSSGDINAWVAPCSPPSPPFQYDPRLAWRVKSPETPSPSYSRAGTRRSDGSAREGAAEKDTFSSNSTAPSSRSSSWISNSALTSTSTRQTSPSTSEHSLKPFIHQAAASTSSLPWQQYQPQAPRTQLLPPISQPTEPIASTSTLTPYINPVSFLTRRSRPSTALPSYSPPLSRASSTQSTSFPISDIRAQQGDGVAKLSRRRIVDSPSTDNNGQPRRSKTAGITKHAHKRSYSVQWQQFERWQNKSRARLRDLLILLLFSLTVAVVLYQICSIPGFSSSSPSRESTYSPSSSSNAVRHPAKRQTFFKRAITKSHGSSSSSIIASKSRQRHLSQFAQPQRDTVIIYRILGNDLPPRHGEGQTIRNLRFMLSQENDFSFLSSPNMGSSSYPLNIEKYYVLNRLTNQDSIDEILALFEEFGVPQDRVLNIPFEWLEYQKRDLRWDGGVAKKENLWAIGSKSTDGELVEEKEENPKLAGLSDEEKSEKQARWETLARLRAMEYTLHDKNLYAINNNGGRNFALEHGRSLPHARWILPLDGNCFFTPSAMSSILQSMLRDEGLNTSPYMIIPMARLLDNNAIHPDNVLPSYLSTANEASTHPDPMKFEYISPDAPEEPQIGFRYDSTASYQSEMRYGRRSKLELLWRLGAIPFERNLHIKKLSWEKPDQTYITAESYNSLSNAKMAGEVKEHFVKGGWVHRLFSGEREQEESSSTALELRRLNRMKGIVSYLEKLDEKLIRGQEGCIDEGEEDDSSESTGIECGFRKDRSWSFDSHHLAILRRQVKAQEPLATMRVKAFEDRTMGLLQRTQGQLRSWQKEKWDQEDPEGIARIATRLALTGYVSSNTSYSVTAAELIQARFLPSTIHTKGASVRTSLDHSVYHSLGPKTGSANRKTEEGSGYAFPLSIQSSHHLWSNGKPTTYQDLRYDPLAFDPSMLLDALRLLSPVYQRNLHLQSLLPSHQLRSIFSHHLSTLLLSPEGVKISSNPETLVQAARYDKSVAALAAYLDDAKLLSRVVNRHSLRYVSPETGNKEQLDGSDNDTQKALQIVEEMHRGIVHTDYPMPEWRDGSMSASDSLFGL